ncbi:MAG: RIP metalloprotease RseP [Desulfuromonas sp.]|nr:MAG: RIP metalloprotease RseP [Desulfuromonas sp.]
MTIIAGIVMLSILVFVHELGHFCVAKLSGVKVLKFSIGFGPKLLSRHWGDTEYLICAIPLGGYVQMLGEGSSADAELTEEEKAFSFAEKPVSRRLAIVAAGPLMNLILPFLVLPVSYLVGVQLPAYYEQPPCVGHVIADSAAANAGFVDGDCIAEVNGRSLSSWNDANKALLGSAGESLIFKIKRQQETFYANFPEENDSLEGLQALGLMPQQAALVGGLAPDMPAVAAGMQVGDRILRVNGLDISSWYDLRPAIQQLDGGDVAVTIERDGQLVELSITPKLQEESGDYLVGISPMTETVEKRFGFIEAGRAGAKRSLELIELTLVFIEKLFTGNVSAKNIGGPITVVQVAGQAAQTDLSAILSVLAFISIQLGILNLLPIPILDGGHIFFYFFEIVFRRPLSMWAREVAQQIGLILLVMLMVLAFYNDLVRLWP